MNTCPPTGNCTLISMANAGEETALRSTDAQKKCSQETTNKKARKQEHRFHVFAFSCVPILAGWVLPFPCFCVLVFRRRHPRGRDAEFVSTVEAPKLPKAPMPLKAPKPLKVPKRLKASKALKAPKSV